MWFRISENEQLLSTSLQTTRSNPTCCPLPYPVLVSHPIPHALQDQSVWFGIPESEQLLDEFHCALRKRVLLQGRLFVFENFGEWLQGCLFVFQNIGG